MTPGGLFKAAEGARRQSDQRFEEVKDGRDRNSEQAERKHEKPNQGIEKESQERHRPADDEQDKPEKKFHRWSSSCLDYCRGIFIRKSTLMNNNEKAQPKVHTGSGTHTVCVPRDIFGGGSFPRGLLQRGGENSRPSCCLSKERSSMNLSPDTPWKDGKERGDFMKWIDERFAAICRGRHGYDVGKRTERL